MKPSAACEVTAFPRCGVLSSARHGSDDSGNPRSRNAERHTATLVGGRRQDPVIPINLHNRCTMQQTSLAGSREDQLVDAVLIASRCSWPSPPDRSLRWEKGSRSPSRARWSSWPRADPSAAGHRVPWRDHHTDCGMETFTDDEVKEQIFADAGLRPGFALEAFEKAEDDVKQTARRIKASPFVPQKRVRGLSTRLSPGRCVRFRWPRWACVLWPPKQSLDLVLAKLTSKLTNER